MKTIRIIGVIVFISVIAQSCKIADLRTKEVKQEGVTKQKLEKGKLLLDQAWKAQGFDKLSEHTVYSYHGQDTWKGMLGRMGNIWSKSTSEMDFKYKIGSFDGQVKFENSNYSGLQNWNYYDIINNDTIFSDLKLKKNERIVFGVSAFQYFVEMIDRLRQAPVVVYQGEDEFRGQMYDLVLCTWGTVEPHMEHDQYVAWINKKTGLMDFTHYTIRDSYLKPPGYKSIGGVIEFTDFKEVEGMLIPHTHLVYALKLRRNPNKNLHKLIISGFKFDDFNPEYLEIDKSISVGGNFK